MTQFLDGPAVGIILYLQRAPVFLRAVQDAAGKWDALDQLDDEPRSGERIIVYRMEGEPSWCHINRRGKGGSGVFRGGVYRVVDPQPEIDDVRSNRAWRAWVAVQAGGELAEDGSLKP